MINGCGEIISGSTERVVAPRLVTLLNRVQVAANNLAEIKIKICSFNDELLGCIPSSPVEEKEVEPAGVLPSLEYAVDDLYARITYLEAEIDRLTKGGVV